MRSRRLVWTVAAILIASVVVPLIDLGPYRYRVQNALGRSLGRKIEISSVHFRIFPIPGIVANDVTIGEDPAIGAEPVAYVGALRATPRILSLFEGRLEFSSVDLEDASLNITRVDRTETGVHWNFSTLAQSHRLATLPSVHMRDGRINFKFGDTKSIFYLLDTDVDLWPPSSAAGPWSLRVRGEPARTDRTARGFGSFDVRGLWQPRSNSTELDVRLEESQLGDMLTLFNGYESGIQGSISGNAHLAGPISHIGIAGRVTVANLHGWSQTPPGGNVWPLAIGGVLDASGQTLDLAAKVAAGQAPIDLRYRVSDYLRRPRWGLTVNLKGFPLSPLVGIARNLGWTIPADFRLDGTANGAVSYSIPEGAPRMDGELSVTNATLAVAKAPPLRLPGADVRFAGTTVTLAPAAIMNDRNETAMLEGAWDSQTRTLDAALSSDGMAIGSLSRQISIAGIPLLSQATEGTWSGNLRYSNESEGWTGRLHLEDTVIPFEAFARPLHIAAADVTIDEDDIDIKHLAFTIGTLAGRATYQYDASAKRPHKFRVVMSRADAGAIEKLLMPALHRGNFFTYAFNFGRAPMPGWLRNMRADGTVQIGALGLAGGEFGSVRTHILWDGMQVRMTAVETQLGDAPIAGSVIVRLDSRQPVYVLNGTVTGLPWRSGTIGAEVSLATSGTGLDLLGNLRARGTFEGEQIDLTPLDAYDSIAGAFECTWDGRSPKLHLSQLIMKSGADTFLGTADTLDNGEVLLKLSDGTKHIQAAGAILQGEAFKVSP